MKNGTAMIPLKPPHLSAWIPIATRSRRNESGSWLEIDGAPYTTKAAHEALQQGRLLMACHYSGDLITCMVQHKRPK